MGSCAGERDRLNPHPPLTPASPPSRSSPARLHVTSGSYNAINGVPACVNHPMLTGILRERFGFDGMIATDCGALDDADTKHNYSTAVCPSCNTSSLRGEKIAELAVRAGVNSNCGSFLGKHMPEVMRKGQVPQATLDDAIARLVRLLRSASSHPRAHSAAPRKPLGLARAACRQNIRSASK